MDWQKVVEEIVALDGNIQVHWTGPAGCRVRSVFFGEWRHEIVSAVDDNCQSSTVYDLDLAQMLGQMKEKTAPKILWACKAMAPCKQKGPDGKSGDNLLLVVPDSIGDKEYATAYLEGHREFCSPDNQDNGPRGMVQPWEVDGWTREELLAWDRQECIRRSRYAWPGESAEAHVDAAIAWIAEHQK